MLIDTHCHINMMVKKEFDVPLSTSFLPDAQKIIDDAAANQVDIIINVGTSLQESENCIAIARHFPKVYATVGLHPNDCTSNWRSDFEKLATYAQAARDYKIVGIGECGIDFHYPDYDKQRQYDAFKAQIELALEHNLALVVHSRDAADETLHILDEYKNQLSATMHCFSYDRSIAKDVVAMGFFLGIDAPITYPKNNELRAVVHEIGLNHIVLETDAPFLPPQPLRGSQNHPKHIATIAGYIAQMLNVPLELVAKKTTHNASLLFNLESRQ